MVSGQTRLKTERILFPSLTLLSPSRWIFSKKRWLSLILAVSSHFSSWFATSHSQHTNNITNEMNKFSEILAIFLIYCLVSLLEVLFLSETINFRKNKLIIFVKSNDGWSRWRIHHLNIYSHHSDNKHIWTGLTSMYTLRNKRTKNDEE